MFGIVKVTRKPCFIQVRLPVICIFCNLYYANVKVFGFCHSEDVCPKNPVGFSWDPSALPQDDVLFLTKPFCLPLSF